MSLFSVPFTFTDAMTSYPYTSSLNANFTSLVNAGNSLTFQNVGTSGFYPSNLIATTSAQGVIGGAQPITFPSSVILGGGLTGATSINASGQVVGASASFTGRVAAASAVFTGTMLAASSNAGTQSYVPPVYDPSGAAIASTAHVVIGMTTLSVGGGATVTLSGAAAFASATSYSVVGANDSGILAMQFTQASGSSFNISGTGNNVISWIAVGA